MFPLEVLSMVVLPVEGLATELALERFLPRVESQVPLEPVLIYHRLPAEGAVTLDTGGIMLVFLVRFQALLLFVGTGALITFEGASFTSPSSSNPCRCLSILMRMISRRARR